MNNPVISRIAAIFVVLTFLGNDLAASVRALNTMPLPRIERQEKSLNHKIALEVTPDGDNQSMLSSTTKKLAPTPSRAVSYFADVRSGYLGSHQKDPLNQPKDDIFDVELSQSPADYNYAYLRYRVKGLANGVDIPKAINNGAAYLGAEGLVRGDDNWQAVSLEVDKSELKAGLNQVRFAMAHQARMPVEIQDVELLLSNSKLEDAQYSAKSKLIEADKDLFQIIEGEADETNITAKAYAIDEANMPAIPNHITNITKGNKAYRLYGAADEKVRISIAVDQAKSPAMNMQRLREAVIFYFDKQNKQWQQLIPEHFDMAAAKLEAEAPGGTDYFAGMIKTPEMPEASAFMPTAISDIKAANPAAGMTFIQPPTVSQTGEAAVSYPLNIPQGRAGMTPQLSLNYSSDGGSGMCGFGWSLPMQSVSIDAKWGVPSFPTNEQEESYVINGSALTMEGGKRGNRGGINNGKLDPTARLTGDVRFFKRTMSAYKEIHRYGNDPKNYYWTEVTADQTTYYYGTTNGTSVDAKTVLTDASGNIVKWYLTKVVDKWGNSIHYNYSLHNPTNLSNAVLNNGKYVRLDEITYTGFEPNSEVGKYRIVFTYTEGRADARVSMKLGVKELDYLQLDEITTYYQLDEIRSFKLFYEDGDFHKRRLGRVEEWTLNGGEFYEHTFGYYNENLTYSSPEAVSVDHSFANIFSAASSIVEKASGGIKDLYKPSPISQSTTKGWGVGGSIGLGIAPLPEPKEFSKEFTFSGHLGGAWSDTRHNRSLQDINGDGLPDMVEKTSDGLVFFPRQQNADGSYSFGLEKKIHGRSQFLESESSTLTYGFDFAAPLNVYFYGQNWNRTTGRTYTYTTDYNADGILDIIERDGNQQLVSFGVLDSKGELRFEETSENTYNPVIKFGALVEEDLEQDPPKDFEITRVWIAPFEGTVTLSGDADLIDDLDGTMDVAIQKNSGFVTGGTFQSVDGTTSANYNLTGISVSPGDKILFRVRSGANGQKDYLNWNPRVTYTGSSANFLDANGYNYGNSTYNDGFLLSGASSADFKGDQALQVSWPAISISGLTDDVVFKIHLRGYDDNGITLDKTYSYTKPNATTGNVSLSQFKDDQNNSASFLGQMQSISSLSSEEYANISFEVWSTSNVSWQDIDWRPMVEFSSVDCGEPEQRIYPTVNYETYNRVVQLCEPLTSGDLEECEEGFTLWPTDELTVSEVQTAFTADEQNQGLVLAAGLSWPITSTSYFVVKTPDQLLYKLALELRSDGTYDYYEADIDGSYDTGSPLTITGPTPKLLVDCGLAVEYPIYFGYYAPNKLHSDFIKEFISTISIYQSIGGDLLPTGQAGNYELFHKEPNVLQDQTLQWGQFAWSKDNQDAILMSELVLSAQTVAEDPANDHSDTEGTEGYPSDTEMNAVADDLNPIDQNFFTLSPVRGENNRDQLRTYIKGRVAYDDHKELDRWAAYGSYMAAYGRDGEVAPGKFIEKENTRNNNPRPPRVEDAYEAFGMTQINKSKTKGITEGVTIPIPGAPSFTNSRTPADPTLKYLSENLSQFMDINGDGYPDALYDDLIIKAAYTHPSGGHKAPVTHPDANSLGYSAASSNAYAAAGTYINDDARFNKIGSASGSLSVNFGSNETLTEWRDVNGDGLPDFLTYSNGNVSAALSTGYNLLSAVPYAAGSGLTFGKPETTSKSYSLGGNMGLGNFGPSETSSLEKADEVAKESGMSFSIGAGLNTTGSNVESMLLDVNGDGLVDMIKYNGSNVQVLINTGNGYEDCGGDCSIGSNDLNDLGRTGNVGLSGSAAASVGIPLIPFIGVKLKMSISLNGSINYGVNRVLSSFMDMNGDGIADYVETDQDGGINVSYAQLGKCNKLKMVTNPLEGSFTVDYERVGNKMGSYPVVVKTHNTQANERMVWDMPSSQWVMSSLTVNDGYDMVVNSIDLDGVDEITYEFLYDGGIKSRRDREFLGFTRVQTLNPSRIPRDQELDCDSEQKRKYMSSVVEYYRPLINNTTEMKKAAFLKGIPLKSYKLFNTDSMHIEGTNRVPIDNGYQDVPYCSLNKKVELLSGTYNTFEYRLVGQDPAQAAKFNKIQEDGSGGWITVSDWAGLDENATIFPAMIGTKTVTVPNKNLPDKVYLTSFALKYDTYFNVTEYSSDAFEGTASQNPQVVGTMEHTKVEILQDEHDWITYISEASPFDDPQTFIEDFPPQSFLDSITIHSATQRPNSNIIDYEYTFNHLPYNPFYKWYFERASLTYYIVNASDNTFGPDTIFGPNWLSADAVACNNSISDGTFYTTHRKVTTTTVDILEDDYSPTLNGRIIAKMWYFNPSSVANQTNMLSDHRIYVDDPTDASTTANLERRTKVHSLNSARLAPKVIRSYFAGGSNYADTRITYTSDGYGNVATIRTPTDFNGERATTTFDYDSDVNQFVTQVTNAHGESVCFNYDIKTGNLRKTRDINGQPTQYEYDDFYRMKEVWGPRELGLSNSAATIAFEYYPNEAVPVAITNHNMNEPEEINDPISGLPNYGAPSGSECTLTADLDERPSMTDPLQTATFMDGMQRPIQVKKDASTIEFALFPNYRLVSGIASYDFMGRAVDVSNSVLENINVAIKSLNTSKDSYSASTATYDDQGRQTASTSIGINTSYSYKWNTINAEDYFGVITETSGLKNQSYKNAYGQDVAMITGSSTGATTTFLYDALNQLHQSTDPVGEVTEYSYDFFGRMTREIHSDRGQSDFTYDKVSNLIKIVTPETGIDGIQMRYKHDRLISKIMPNSGHINDVEYTYGSLGDGLNGAGRVVEVLQGDNFAKTLYRYDELGNMVYEQKRLQVPQAGIRTFTHNFLYDSFGRINKLTYPDGAEVHYLYHKVGGDLKRMYSVDDPVTAPSTTRDIITNMNYDGYGNVSKILYGNGAESNFSYQTNERRLERIYLQQNGGTTNDLLDKTIIYDGRGNVNSIDNAAAPVTTSTGQLLGGQYFMDYSYDDLNRLKSMAPSTSSGYRLGTGSAIPYDLTMGYDAAGSILSKTETIGATTNTISYAYGTGQSFQDQKHRLRQTTHPANNQRSYTFNGAGSVTEVATVPQSPGQTANTLEKFCWDEEQKLVAAEVNGTVSHYMYDHTGERLMKTSLNYISGGVNGNQSSNGNYTMNPYTVYASAYYVATHYTNDIVASKHYFMGSQRVASGVLSLPFVMEQHGGQTGQGGPEEGTGEEDPLDPTETYIGTGTPGSETALEQDLICLGLSGTGGEPDFVLSKLLEQADYEVMRLVDFENATENCAVANDACYCAIDPVRAELEGYDCSSLEIMYFYHPDYLGSNEFITDMNGKAYQYFFRTPWGESIVDQHSQSGMLNSPYRFNGKELDPETGNYYYGARYYNPTLSMWLSVDALAYKFPAWSPYNFTLNNPINLVDPDGNAPDDPDVVTKVTGTKDVGSTLRTRKVSMTVNLTVVNMTGSNLSKTHFNSSSGSFRIEGFEGSATRKSLGQNVPATIDKIENFTVNYKVVNSLSDVGENDHVMMIVNSIPEGEYDGKLSDPIGLANIGGRISAVEAGTVADGTFNEVSTHELGHNMGLKHVEGGLMHEHVNGETSLSKTQKGKVLGLQVSPVQGDGTYRDTQNDNGHSKAKAQQFLNANAIK